MKSSVIYRHTALILTLAAAMTYTVSCISQVDGYGSFPYLELADGSTTSHSIGNAGGSITVALNTNRTVTATCDQPWLKATATGDGETATVSITVSPNEEETPRSATVSLSIPNVSSALSILITQDESGNHTYSSGDVLLYSDDGLTAFAGSYNRIAGNLILGYASNHQETRPTSVLREYYYYINDYMYCFEPSAGLTDLSPLDQISWLGGDIYLMLNTELRTEELEHLVRLGAANWTVVDNDRIIALDCLDGSGVTGLTVHYSPNLDFNSIRGLGLSYLNISSNYLEDISFLSSGFEGLTTLILGTGDGTENNSIRDITPLLELEGIQHLDISGLPISQASINMLQNHFGNADITADNMANAVPVIGEASVMSRTPAEITFYAEITNIGSPIERITDKGFYFGTVNDIDQMQKYPADLSAMSETDIQVTVAGLDSSTVYYAIPYAVNSMGTSYGDAVETNTLGRGILANEISSEPYHTEIYVTDNMLLAGGNEVYFGFVLGDSESLSLDDNLAYRENQYIENQIELPHLMDARFDGLSSGSAYFVRSYIRNEYGTTYSDPVRVFTLGEAGGETARFTAEATAPLYSNDSGQPVEPLSNMYRWYFRDDKAGNGVSEYSYSSEGRFQWDIIKGRQTLVFSNADAASEWENGGDMLVWDYSGYAFLPSDLLIYTVRDINLTQDTTVAMTPSRVSAMISSLTMSYFDELGQKYQNLSEHVSGISVTVTGMSTTYTLDRNMNGVYSGSNSMFFEIGSGDVSTTDTQMIAGDINVLPSATGEQLTVDVTITFTDGNSTTLNGSFKALEPNNIYDLAVNLYSFESDAGTSFTIDIINNIPEEIEF